MTEIVDKYIQVNELFQQCMNDKLENDGSYQAIKSQMQLYYIALDNFIKAARTHYSNDKLDLNTAMNLFNSDPTVQDELKQYFESKSKGHSL